MNDVMCDNCGLVALADEGGQPVTVQQTAYVPQYEYGSLAHTDRLMTFAATYCSLRCAAEALAINNEGDTDE